jgi:hypothetical protein
LEEAGLKLLKIEECNTYSNQRKDNEKIVDKVNETARN